MNLQEKSLQKATADKEFYFDDIAGQWLQKKKSQVKTSTYHYYSYIVHRHILSELKQVRISSLTDDLMINFITSKRINGRLDGTGGLSNKTVADLRAILKQILDYAAEQGYLKPGQIILPAAGAKQPEILILSRREQMLLERTLHQEQTPFHLGIWLSLYCGLRIGEICALQWKDFDFLNGTVYIHKTVSRIYDISDYENRCTKLVIHSPKTDSSIRRIPLPDFLWKYLLLYRQPEEAYLLTGTSRLMEPRLCLKHYKKILKKSGLPDYTFHTLRHTFATRCVENDFDIKSLSEIMGHSSITITMQRYVHPSMDLKRLQMNRLTMLSDTNDTNITSSNLLQN